MKTILILGAGLWQIPYLRKAKEMGLHVCATDWSDNPEGKKYADVFESISVRDKEKTLTFAIENKIDAVFTNSDVAVPTVAYVAECLNIPCYTQQQANIATNKFQMRNFIKAIGLQTPEYFLCATLEELREKYALLGKKCIIKPIDNCGSRGVYIINTQEQLLNLAHETFENSFSGKILIEEFMVGKESSVEVLVNEGKPTILGWCKKIKSPEPYRFDIQLDYFPDFSEKEHEDVCNLVDILVNGLKYQNGIMHIEFMWTTSGIKIIEFALRGCGSNVITHLMPILRGFDIMEFLLKKAIGETINVNLTKNLFGTLKFIIPSEGIVKSLSGIDTILQMDGLLDFYTDLQAGYKIEAIKNGRSRPGHFIVFGESREEVFSKIDFVENNLQIEYND